VPGATQWTINLPVVAAQGALALWLVHQSGSKVIGIPIAASGFCSDHPERRRMGARATVTPVGGVRVAAVPCIHRKRPGREGVAEVYGEGIGSSRTDGGISGG